MSSWPRLYLIEILHQTTTTLVVVCLGRSCILLKFYIKPQLLTRKMPFCNVVSYWNSTSNHNSPQMMSSGLSLYLIEILHQTTTGSVAYLCAPTLYLIEILHQTTTKRRRKVPRSRCILLKFYIKPQRDKISTSRNWGCILLKFYIKPQLRNHLYRKFASCILLKFYIKPQLLVLSFYPGSVVSYWNSTSNHNRVELFLLGCNVVSYWNSTSNHNIQARRNWKYKVVSYWNSTSNHNLTLLYPIAIPLYLIEILHQTTTSLGASL